MPNDSAALLPLADACERAEIGSAEIDGLIFAWQQGEPPSEINKLIYGPDDHAVVVDGYWKRAPRFTRSMDAAMSLLPAEHMWRAGHLDDGRFYTLTMSSGGTSQRAKAATPPLAFVAAALRATTPPPLRRRQSESAS